MKKRTWATALIVAALCVVALILAGCGGSNDTTTTAAGGATGSTAGAVQTGGTLSYFIIEPSYIDPYNVSETQGVAVEHSLFTPLVEYDAVTNEIKPGVAQTWEPNADGTVWTFHLTPNTKFHDGTTVTAENFKYAWERIADPKNKSDISYHLSAIKGFDEMQTGKATKLAGVVAKDPNTLEVTLTYPFGDFQYIAGHPSLGPVPLTAPRLVSDDPKGYESMPVGNGPFKMAEPWKHEQYIKVVKFADYFGAKPNIDGIDFKIFKDNETAFTEFKAGTIDFTDDIPSGQIAATKAQYGVSNQNGGLTANPGNQVINGPELSTYYMWVNNKDQYLKNADLRKAMSLAINRQAIADAVFEGTRAPATGPVPKGIVGYQPNAWPESTYDVTKAKEFLTKAGYPNGQGLPTLTMSFNTGSNHEKVFAIIQSDLEKIGIKTKNDPHQWAEYISTFTKVKDGQWVNPQQVHQLIRLGWVADYPIMDNFLYPLFSTNSGDNKALYSNPEVDNLIKQARGIVDPAARIQAYQAIEKKIGEVMPLVPIVDYTHKGVTSNRVHNLTYSPLNLADYTSVWLSK